MIENEMAKLENPDHERLSSWLYPSLREVLLVVGHLVEIGHEFLHARRDAIDRRLDPPGFCRPEACAKIGMNSDH